MIAFFFDLMGFHQPPLLTCGPTPIAIIPAGFSG
uniref:Uncharacterized protein n=1 Tax=Siphoviridae sp. ctTnV63 TaxID=2825523 RepID=A0A8S5NUY6_9CAUD|nr:MAG TPA: hypothetical protein [Siphoviridae sp. ctTnV63]